MRQDPSAASRQPPSPDDAAEQVRRVSERLALLHYAFARSIIDALGPEDGRRLTMKAIKRYASLIGEKVRAQVEARGLEALPEQYAEDLPNVGMHRKLERVQVDGEPRTRVHGCVMGEVWQALDASELGALYCLVDPAKMMAYNTDFKLVHHKSLPRGDAYCEFSIYPTTPEDREAFSAEETDLARLDTP